jgi:hypothetical protein
MNELIYRKLRREEKVISKKQEIARKEYSKMGRMNKIKKKTGKTVRNGHFGCFGLLFYKFYTFQWSDFTRSSPSSTRTLRDKHVSVGNRIRFACVAGEHSSIELFEQLF